MLGLGIAYSSLEEVLDSAVHWRHREKIRMILTSTKPDMIDYEHLLMACPRCESLYSRFYVNIRKNNEVLYESRFSCPKCRTRLVSAKKSIDEYRCRSCGQRMLEHDGDIMWD